MQITDHLITDFTNAAFQKAFKLYFEELGINVTKWAKLFDEMNNDPHGRNLAYVRMTGDNDIIGFIQFAELGVNSWFFETKVGFIREFWIAREYRAHGHGSQLLKHAEEYFRAHGLFATILTTDTAESFYKKHGYARMDSIRAENHEPVMVKMLKS